MPINDNNWIVGGSILGFQWASMGDQLLVQTMECFRLFDVGEGLTELVRQDLDSADVVGWGTANGSWWFVVKDKERVCFRRGLDVECLVLEKARASTISLAALSPDGESLACADSGLTVAVWSAETGRRLFDVRTEVEAQDHDIFGAPKIDRLVWSADSKYLAVQPSFPVEGMMVIDVRNHSLRGSIE